MGTFFVGIRTSARRLIFGKSQMASEHNPAPPPAPPARPPAPAAPPPDRPPCPQTIAASVLPSGAIAMAESTYWSPVAALAEGLSEPVL